MARIICECGECGKLFHHANIYYKPKYCSKQCRLKGSQKRSGPPKPCEECGQEFQPNVPNQRFCNSECRNKKYWRENPPGISKNAWTLFSRDNFSCIYCGRSSLTDAVKLHLDHIYPKSKGGKDCAGNLVTACGECNMSKGASLLSANMRFKLEAIVRQRNQKCNIADGAPIGIRNA